jgi:LysR family glycine cleavage system transcriptional activator
MVVRLPPLNALRAFEAAGRHLSFTRAARELNVTQAAVSHQVKALEAVLGVKLFRRHHRALSLTEAGQLYLPVLRDAFAGIAAATERLRRRDAVGVLTVSTLASFAATWLVPRLGRFRDAHPEIDVRIAASHRLVDFGREDIDLAIRYGRGEWPGLHAEPFLTEDIAPVCSPALLASGPPLRRPADLRHHVLLHDEWFGDPYEGWRRWLAAFKLDGIAWQRGPVFSDSSMVVRAAVEGQGVALGRGVLIAEDVAAGRLVRLFDASRPANTAYFIVCPPAALERAKVAAFRDWLLAEARADDGKKAGGRRTDPPKSGLNREDTMKVREDHRTSRPRRQ